MVKLNILQIWAILQIERRRKSLNQIYLNFYTQYSYTIKVNWLGLDALKFWQKTNIVQIIDTLCLYRLVNDQNTAFIDEYLKILSVSKYVDVCAWLKVTVIR